MSICSSKRQTGGAMVLKRLARPMDITLHIGPHRTGTTCFQNYMQRAQDALSEDGVAFWGPQQTRDGVFAGVYSRIKDRRGAGDNTRFDQDLQERLDAAREAGVRHLVVSEENMMGSIGQNVRHKVLYKDVGKRVAHFAQAFGDEVTSIVISPRSLDVFWCSSLAYAVSNGLTAPDAAQSAAIARSFRGWRHVVADIASAVPEVELKVLPFDEFAGRPDRFLEVATGLSGPVCTDRTPVNASPRLPELRRAMLAKGMDTTALPFGMGRWNPFTNEQHSALRELFADDMMWLTAGADGLATLIEDRSVTQAGQNPPRAAQEKGQFDECEERRLARPG